MKLMNHMVESARQKDVIEKLQCCLKQKSIEIKAIKRKLQNCDNARDPTSVVEDGTKNENTPNDEKDQGPKVGLISSISFFTGEGRIRDGVWWW